jgi:hypothetical protein
MIVSLFNFFKNKKQTESKQPIIQQLHFDVLEEKTWISASNNKTFTWKDNSFFDKDSDNKSYLSEKIIITLLSSIMKEIDKLLSKTTIERYGRNNIISEFLDGLAEGLPNEEILGKIVQKILYGHRSFNVLDLESWNFASTKSILWKNETLYNTDGEPITEIDMVQLFRAMFAFLSKKEPLTIEQQIKAVNTLLDRMASHQADPNWSKNKNHPQKTIEKDSINEPSKFNPRDQETYKYATDRQLIIDGKEIWTPMYEGNRKIKSPVSEESFVDMMKIFWKNDYAHIRAFNMAMSEMKNGIEPELKETIERSNITIGFHYLPKYKDKFFEIYKKIKQQLPSEVPEIIDKDFIEDRIYQYLWDMDHRKSIIRKTK